MLGISRWLNWKFPEHWHPSSTDVDFVTARNEMATYLILSLSTISQGEAKSVICARYSSTTKCYSLDLQTQCILDHGVVPLFLIILLQNFSFSHRKWSINIQLRPYPVQSLKKQKDQTPNIERPQQTARSRNECRKILHFVQKSNRRKTAESRSYTHCAWVVTLCSTHST